MAGDLVRLPMGSRHGIFNKTEIPTRALFWVAPARRLYDLFVQLDGLRDPPEVVRRSAACNVLFLPPGPVAERSLPAPGGGVKPVLIAGGGVGGLTLALMLHERGIPCQVYEAVEGRLAARGRDQCAAPLHAGAGGTRPAAPA